MKAFRALFVSLLFGALVAAGPAAALTAVAVAPDCALTSSAGSEDGCCGGNAGMPDCDMACALSFAAVIGREDKVATLALGAAPLERHSAEHRLLSRQPDTAPPKSFAA